jgi:hypothetical protein
VSQRALLPGEAAQLGKTRYAAWHAS